MGLSVCGAIYSAIFRANAIRPCKWRKPQAGCFFRDPMKTTFDVGKTTSYAGKIMSDVIQTTSDIIFAVAIV